MGTAADHPRTRAIPGGLLLDDGVAGTAVDRVPGEAMVGDEQADPPRFAGRLRPTTMPADDLLPVHLLVGVEFDAEIMEKPHAEDRVQPE